jgi:hypothetical protein
VFSPRSYLNSRRWTKSRNPVIPSVIHHRQEPLDFACGLALARMTVEAQGQCEYQGAMTHSACNV